MNIYIGNLAYSATDNDLRNLFSEYGTVNSAKVIMDRYTDRSRGFAFVEMENNDEAMSAINELNGRELQSRPIIVKEARPKNDNYGGGRDRDFRR